MKFPLLFLLMSINIILAKKLVYRNHTCIPSGYSRMCILEDLRYDPKQKHVIHSFPANQSHIRITSDSRSSTGSLVILDVNPKLYTLLGKPAIFEMQGYAMWDFELPRALRQGIFRRLYITEILVEPGTDIPKVVYLDLSGNYVRDIANISSLENLEVLLLRSNDIRNIDSDTLKNLTKLRILDLGNNYLSKISLDVFPKSLIHLNLFFCEIESLNYNHLYYPSMQVLNLEQNMLTSIDASALMLAMPNLKMVRIGSNSFNQDELQQALRLFIKHNISYRDEADEAACNHNEQILEGVCVGEPDPPRGVLRDILLSFAVVLVAVALGATLTWVLRAMRGKAL